MSWAEEYPGRLAARLLQRMENNVGRDGEANSWAKDSAPAAARAYHIRVLKVTYPDMTPRNARELHTLAVLLDHLALGRTKHAADIIAQRIKALERSIVDMGKWDHAQYLELIPPPQSAAR